MQVVGRDVAQVGGVLARDHQQMAARGGVDVHERDRALVLVHARRRHLAGDDLAEQAVGIRGHRRSAGYTASLGAHAGRHLPPARNRRAPGVVRPAIGVRGRAAGGRVDPRRARGGGRPARVEEEPAVGSMPLPLGLLSAAGVLAGARRPPARPARPAGGGGDRRRRLGRAARLPPRAAPPADLQRRPATAGDPEAEETLVFVAHHDAANGGLIFRPELSG